MAEGHEEATRLDWHGRVDWKRFISDPSRGCTPGGVDLILVGSGSLKQRMGELIATALMLVDRTSRVLYPKVRLVQPVELDANDTVNLDDVFEAVNRIRGTMLSVEEGLAVTERAEFIRVSKSTIDAFEAVMRASPEPTFVAVTHCARYRGDPIPSQLPAAAFKFEEDLWVPQLLALAQCAIDLVEETRSAVLLDAGVLYPHRPENLELLQSVPGAVLGATMEQDPLRAVILGADGWVAMSRDGKASFACAEIDVLDGLTRAEKLLLKIQVLSHADHTALAVGLIHDQFELLDRSQLRTLPDLAQLAEREGEQELAKRLLIALPDDAELSIAAWEKVLPLSRRLEVNSVEHLATQRLEVLAPDSSILRAHQQAHWIEVIDGTSDRPLTFTRATPFGRFAHELLALLRRDRPDYDQTIAEIERAAPDLRAEAHLACAVHAQRHDEMEAAVHWARPQELSGAFARRAVRCLIWAIQAELLGRRQSSAQDALLVASGKVVDYLAANPNEGAMRVDFTTSLSVQSAATTGIVLLAKLTVDLAGAQHEFDDKATASDHPVDVEAFGAFMRDAAEWIQQQGSKLLGSVELPRTLLNAPADALMGHLEQLVRQFDNANDDIGLDLLLAIAFALSPHTTSKIDDLGVLKHVSAKLVSLGQRQKARDQAEQALTTAGSSPLRKRAAWSAFADTYLRCESLVDALVGTAAMLASRVAIDQNRALNESAHLFRLLRDLKLTTLAAEQLEHCRERAAQLGGAESVAVRIETMRIGLELSSIHDLERVDAETVHALTLRAFANLEAVLEHHDDVAPITVQAAQLIDLLGRLGGQREPHWDDALDRACDGNLPLTRLLRTLRPETCGAAEVLALARTYDAARYSDDAGRDIGHLRRAARKLLDAPETERDPTVAALALELSCDLGVAQQRSEQNADSRPTWIPQDLASPADAVRALSRDGASICMLGMSERGRLVRVTASNGNLSSATEPSEVFSQARLSAWSKTFPYAFGIEMDINNLFYSAMDGLGLSDALDALTVFVLDTQVHQLPPQLLLVNHELLGRSTRVSIAPSLTWLARARNRQRVQQKPPVAWIPTADDTRDGTLAMLSERLGDTLDEYSIPLIVDTQIGDRLNDLQLAVVAAHGGLAVDDRYFQVVADEAQLRVSAPTLARALRNTEVVILFVCSGGRLDWHPVDGSSIGLPKQLLDRGCSAVVASPWPLDARVPSHWLPAFLREWNAGAPLIDAVFAANKAVESAMGDSPALCMAMTLFGDYALKKWTSP